MEPQAAAWAAVEYLQLPKVWNSISNDVDWTATHDQKGTFFTCFLAKYLSADYKISEMSETVALLGKYAFCYFVFVDYQ